MRRAAIRLAVLATAAALPAPAATAPLRIDAYVEARQGGVVLLGPAAHAGVRAGQTLLFRSRLDARQRRARQVTAAVPARVELVDALGPVAMSIDGGRSYAPLSELHARDAGALRPARMADVTHLRWHAAAHGGLLPDAILFRGQVL